MHKPGIIAALEQAARRNRFRLFRRLFGHGAPLDRPTRILDIGGTWAYWNQMNWSALGSVEIVLLNLSAQEPLPPGFTSVVGDGRDLSNYFDHDFDIVYSNSVLGHVGALSDQERMASEIRRVGRSYFIQTPNRWFVIDWRTLVPFFHYLPVAYQAWCFRHCRVGTYPRIADYSDSLYHASRVRNLSYRELKRLFPGSTIVPERTMGLTKSFVVHSGFGGAPRRTAGAHNASQIPTAAGTCP